MTDTQLALLILFSGFIVCVLLNTLFLFWEELLSTPNHLVKFLVYDVYTRLFPKQFHNLVIMKLIRRCGIHELGFGAYRLLQFLQSSPCVVSEYEQRPGQVVVNEQPVWNARLKKAFDYHFKLFLDRGDVTTLWVRVIESGLGYYSHSLFMRVKPFREEILKERLCALYSLPNQCKKQIREYHAADGDYYNANQDRGTA